MNALLKDVAQTRAPVRGTDRKPSAREMFERMQKRYPETIARLAE